MISIFNAVLEHDISFSILYFGIFRLIGWLNIWLDVIGFYTVAILSLIVCLFIQLIVVLS